MNLQMHFMHHTITTEILVWRILVNTLEAQAAHPDPLRQILVTIIYIFLYVYWRFW